MDFKLTTAEQQFAILLMGRDIQHFAPTHKMAMEAMKLLERTVQENASMLDRLGVKAENLRGRNRLLFSTGGTIYFGSPTLSTGSQHSNVVFIQEPTMWDRQLLLEVERYVPNKDRNGKAPVVFYVYTE